MAEYTNDHIEIKDLPKGIQIDGIGDTLPEGGDGIKVPLMENGKPYPAQIAAEEPLETDYDSDENENENEDEDHTEANYDRFGHDVCYGDFCSNAIRTLQAAGVRFDKTTWVNISNGSLEFTIKAQD